ncbi:hypothetical protein FALCPG4_018241 [Fusarium falciforme]
MPSHTKRSQKSRHGQDNPKGSSGKKRRQSDRPSKGRSGKESHKKTKDVSGVGSTEFLNLYCAMYTPRFGNFYHWAFALYRPSTQTWLLLEVTQEDPESPFVPEARQVDPRSSRRCLQPLTYLGQMNAGWMESLEEMVEQIPVPGEAASWNCQDYVMDIWEAMLGYGMIDQDTYNEGYNRMLPYYGQDFGGEEEENEGMEYEESHEEQEGEYKSAEFVEDSSSN